MDTQSRLRARSQSGCFVCGTDNPRGLQIQFERRGDCEMAASRTPVPISEGFRGIIHGGVVTTVLDESMSKAVAATGTEALTAELRIRFRRHVKAGDSFQVRGWLVSRQKRLAKAESVLTALDGTEHAHAWATFLPLPGHAGLKAGKR